MVVGDALNVNEGENIVIRRVRTEWTGSNSTDNGAYGIYPAQTPTCEVAQFDRFTRMASPSSS